MKSIVLFPNDSTIYPYLLIVEITIGYLTLNEVLQGNIYNSRNYYRLLNFSIKMGGDIIYNSRNYYRLLNYGSANKVVIIYNSRNYYRLLNCKERHQKEKIYNSRNYYRLLNKSDI